MYKREDRKSYIIDTFGKDVFNKTREQEWTFYLESQIIITETITKIDLIFARFTTVTH